MQSKVSDFPAFCQIKNWANDERSDRVVLRSRSTWISYRQMDQTSQRWNTINLGSACFHWNIFGWWDYSIWLTWHRKEGTWWGAHERHDSGDHRNDAVSGDLMARLGPPEKNLRWLGVVPHFVPLRCMRTVDLTPPHHQKVRSFRWKWLGLGRLTRPLAQFLTFSHPLFNFYYQKV